MLGLLLILALPEWGSAVTFIPRSVCYGGYGCFSTGGKYYHVLRRPFSLLPQSPEELDVQFYLTGMHSRFQAIKIGDVAKLNKSGFDPHRKTYFIIHGFLDGSNNEWTKSMTNALLESNEDEKDDNVFLVDWRNGAVTFNYPQAVANTRLVGVILAKYIEWLEEARPPFSRSMVHVIGHSLGAHTAGYAGEALGGELAEITGLDAAGPFFSGLDREVRLDPNDAKFVQAIHTDAMSIINVLRFRGMGITEPSGHLDIYVNGGNNQPGCAPSNIFDIIGEKGPTEGIKWGAVCPHMRVIDLMIETIKSKKNCQFKAYPCDTYENYKTGACLECGATGCANMGFKASQWNPNGKTFVKMFLDTNGKPPFCNVAYKVTVKGDNERLVKGKLRIRFIKKGEYDRAIELTPENNWWRPWALTVLKQNIDDSIEAVDKIDVQFLPSSDSVSNNFGIRRIELWNGENQRRFIFQGPVLAGQTPKDMLPQ